MDNILNAHSLKNNAAKASPTSHRFVSPLKSHKDKKAKESPIRVKESPIKPKQATPAQKQPFTFANAKLDELQHNLALGTVYKELQTSNKLQRLYPDGIKLESYDTGVTKEIQPAGFMKLRFLNGDWKEIHSNGHETYFFASKNILVNQHTDGTGNLARFL